MKEPAELPDHEVTTILELSSSAKAANLMSRTSPTDA